MSLASIERCLLGGEFGRHHVQGEGTFDQLQNVGSGHTIRGSVDSATLCTLTDLDAEWPDDVISAPASIISGKGRGQWNRIVAVSVTTLILRHAWRILPDTTSVYAIGAVPWSMTSGTYRFVAEHQQDDFQHCNRRRVRVVAQPTEDDGQINMRLFLDHNPDPREDFISYEVDGVKTTLDDDYIVLNITREPDAPDYGPFSGYRHLEISQQLTDRRFANNWLTTELSGHQQRDPVILYTFGVDGAQ